MKHLKTILAILGALAVIFVVIGIFSFIYAALWYVIVFGILAGGAYAGYKLLNSEPAKPQLGEKMPNAIAEMENHERTLDEYKQKYLTK